MPRYTVSVDAGLDKFLDKIEGMGEKKPTIILSIVRAYLSEHSMITTEAKKKM